MVWQLLHDAEAGFPQTAQSGSALGAEGGGGGVGCDGFFEAEEGDCFPLPFSRDMEKEVGTPERRLALAR